MSFVVWWIACVANREASGFETPHFIGMILQNSVIILSMFKDKLLFIKDKLIAYSFAQLKVLHPRRSPIKFDWASADSNRISTIRTKVPVCVFHESTLTHWSDIISNDIEVPHCRWTRPHVVSDHRTREKVASHPPQQWQRKGISKGYSRSSGLILILLKQQASERIISVYKIILNIKYKY